MPRKNTKKPVGIVVRRGAHRRFEGLTEKAAGLPVVVSWDRRQGDRRASTRLVAETDQRTTERRQKPPFTWEAADFVVLDHAPEQASKKGRP